MEIQPPTQPNTTTPTSWGQVAFWSLIPAILIIPAWIAFGRGIFGVSGWNMLIFALTLLPLSLLYHILIEVLAWFGPVKRSLSNKVTLLLGIYYVAVLVFGISVIDYSDVTNSENSGLMVLGFSEIFTNVMTALSALLVVGTAITIVVFLIMDIVKARKAKIQNTTV